jgi:hypothetical protein
MALNALIFQHVSRHLRVRKRFSAAIQNTRSRKYRLQCLSANFFSRAEK